MLAITVFLIIGGAAVRLFSQHTKLFSSQQNQIGLNISMRNALTQMENDVVNAGTGYYTAAPISSFPVGITIQNSGAAFDTLNVITPNTSVPAAHPDNGTGTGCINTNTMNTIYLVPVAGSGLTAAQFKNGDELLFMTGGVTASGRSQMTTVVLTADGIAGPGTEITLKTTTTNADGTNNPAAVPNPD